MSTAKVMDQWCVNDLRKQRDMMMMTPLTADDSGGAGE